MTDTNDNVDPNLPDNVVMFTGVTPLPMAPEMVIRGALRYEAKEAIVLGYDGDGNFFFVSSEGDGPKCLWLLAKAQKKLLEYGEQYGERPE